MSTHRSTGTTDSSQPKERKKKKVKLCNCGLERGHPGDCGTGLIRGRMKKPKSERNILRREKREDSFH